MKFQKFSNSHNFLITHDSAILWPFLESSWSKYIDTSVKTFPEAKYIKEIKQQTFPSAAWKKLKELRQINNILAAIYTAQMTLVLNKRTYSKLHNDDKNFHHFVVAVPMMKERKSVLELRANPVSIS